MGHPLGPAAREWQSRKMQIEREQQMNYYSERRAFEESKRHLRSIASNMLVTPPRFISSLPDCDGCGAPRTQQKCGYCGRGQ